MTPTAPYALVRRPAATLDDGIVTFAERQPVDLDLARDHVVVLDERTVLMSSTAPRTAAILRERGLTVVAVEVSEFEKRDGCVTCLSVRVRPRMRPGSPRVCLARPHARDPDRARPGGHR